MTQPVMPNSPYGTDFWLGGPTPDADPSIRLTTGRQLLSQSLLCRFTTPRGSVIDCPNDCLDLRNLVSKGYATGSLTALSGQIQQEALKDARVQSVSATTSFNAATNTLTVTMNLASLYGPFQLVLEIDSVTAQILNANLPSAT